MVKVFSREASILWVVGLVLAAITLGGSVARYWILVTLPWDDL